jgi:hypothetical protein
MVCGYWYEILAALIDVPDIRIWMWVALYAGTKTYTATGLLYGSPRRVQQTKYQPAVRPSSSYDMRSILPTRMPNLARRVISSSSRSVPLILTPEAYKKLDKVCPSFRSPKCVRGG